MYALLLRQGCCSSARHTICNVCATRLSCSVTQFPEWALSVGRWAGVVRCSAVSCSGCDIKIGECLRWLQHSCAFHRYDSQLRLECATLGVHVFDPRPVLAVSVRVALSTALGGSGCVAPTATAVTSHVCMSAHEQSQSTCRQRATKASERVTCMHWDTPHSHQRSISES
jgi:hypothetical protein